MKDFTTLYQSGAVKRWHTRFTLKEQDVAAHSWGVAMIVAYVEPEASAALLKAALVHDCAEISTGDVPYPVKRDHEPLRTELSKVEGAFEDEHEISYQLTDHELHILKWADMMELLLWTKRELLLGNNSIMSAQLTAIRVLMEMGAPTARATELLKTNMVPTFGTLTRGDSQ